MGSQPLSLHGGTFLSGERERDVRDGLGRGRGSEEHNRDRGSREAKTESGGAEVQGLETEGQSGDSTGKLGEGENRDKQTQCRYLQPIDVGQDVGVPESFEALEGSFGHLGLLVGSRLHVVHENGHQAACGLEEREARGVGARLTPRLGLGLTIS